MSDTLQERLLTPVEVAEVLRVTRRYVWRLGREGHLGEVIEVGKYRRYTEAGVRRYLELGRQAPVQIGAAAARLEAPAAAPAPTSIELRQRRRLR